MDRFWRGFLYRRGKERAGGVRHIKLIAELLIHPLAPSSKIAFGYD